MTPSKGIAIWIALILTCTLVQVVVGGNKHCEKTADYCFTITLPDKNLPDNEKWVEFSLETNANTGWLGLGIGEGMTGYLMVSWYNKKDKSITLSQREGDQPYEPTAQPSYQKELKLVTNKTNGIDENGRLVIHFMRLQKVRDSIINENQTIAWAVGVEPPSGKESTATIQQHTFNGNAYMTLTQSNEDSDIRSSRDGLIIAHATIMFIAWLVGSVLAIFIARFARSLLPRSWFHLHWSLQVFIVTPLIIIGFALSCVSAGGLYVDDPHKIVGLILFFGWFIQLAIGGIHHKLFNPHRGYTPWWTQLHWWFGRALMVLAVFQIPLGLSLYKSAIALFYIYYAYIFTVLLAFSFLSIRLWNSNRGGVKEGAFTKMPED